MAGFGGEQDTIVGEGRWRARFDEIGFVAHHKHPIGERNEVVGELDFGGCRIDEPENKVGGTRSFEGAADAFLLDAEFRLPNAGGIGEDHGVAAEVETDFDDVAGGAGLFTDDRGRPARECIEKA